MNEQIEVRDMRNGGWVWTHDFIVKSKHLSAFHKTIYQTLCCFADNKKQNCYPSMKKIAEAANMSRPKAIECIADLREFGLIDVQRGGHGAKSTNKYSLLKVTAESMAYLEARWDRGQSKKRIAKLKNKCQPRLHLKDRK